jgi:hypothetical protein
MSFDAASKTATLHGNPLMFYVKDGKVYKVGLRKSDSPSATQVSSLASACDVVLAHQLTADGLNAWLNVKEAGADGDCATVVDNRTIYARSSMDATTAAISLPTGVSLLDSLEDAASGESVGFLMLEAGAPSKLAFYDTNLARVGDVAGGGSISAIVPVSDEPTAQSALYRVDGTLRRLTWTASGATLSGSLYAFTDRESGAAAADDSTTYFADGPKLLKVAPGGTPENVATVSASSILTLTMSDDYVMLTVMDPASPSNPIRLASVAKSDGTAVDLPGSTVDSRPSWIVAVRGDKVLYTQPLASGLSQLRAVDADAKNDALVADNIEAAHSWMGRTIKLASESVAAEGAVFCEPAAGETTCAHGTLKQYDIGSGAFATLGSFSSSASEFSWSPTFLLNGLPAAIAAKGKVAAVDDVDMYIVTPGTAGSLTRITKNLP